MADNGVEVFASISEKISLYCYLATAFYKTHEYRKAEVSTFKLLKKMNSHFFVTFTYNVFTRSYFENKGSIAYVSYAYIYMIVHDSFFINQTSPNCREDL